VNEVRRGFQNWFHDERFPTCKEKGEKMFRYLARRYDRKHILRSLERQRRIHDKAIPFFHDGSDEFVFNEISEGEVFFRAYIASCSVKGRSG
jgi:hypothetical protein